jgi:uncharacterized protein (DUF488 family)
MQRVDQADVTVLTIGHSNHSIERFVALLTMHRIEEAVDTRSHPYSKHAPQFNREPISASLSRSGIRYLYLGEQLGGRPSENEYYDEVGRLLIERVWESQRFRQGISCLVSEIHKWHVALLCAEENPARCHRRRLIAPVLITQGGLVGHIRGDGSVWTEAEIAREAEVGTAQMALFGPAAFARR